MDTAWHTHMSLCAVHVRMVWTAVKAVTEYIPATI